jgi:hypothetical protein
VYVIPTIKALESGKLNDFLNIEKSKDGTIIDIPSEKTLDLSSFLDKNRVFIMGEPGYGKSRLLKELLLKYENQNWQIGFIDLKDIDSDIFKFIKEGLAESNSLTKLFQSDQVSYFSQNFQLANNNAALFLDALDEIQSDIIPQILSQIYELINQFPNLHVVVSCRTHHAIRYKKKLIAFDFEYARITAFSIHQLIKYLQLNCDPFKGSDYKEILTQLERFIDLSSRNRGLDTLFVPRYLEVFTSLVNDLGLENIEGINRQTLFGTLIKRRLMVESSRKEGYRENYNRKIPYIIQCFERIALIMEIQRVNKISKDDLVSFEIDTGLNIGNQLLLEIFYDGTLLKDTGDFLEFDNTEFQEYLAAKALSRIGRPDQIIFELGVNPILNVFYPSWISVFNYLIEFAPDLAYPIVKFGIRASNPEVFYILRNLDIQAINSSTREDLFKLTFDYHALNKRWFWDDLAGILVRCYSPSKHNSYLDSQIENQFNFNQYFVRTLIAEILREYYKLNSELHDEFVKHKWKNKLKSWLSDSFKFGTVMHREVIDALSYISSIDDLDDYQYLLYQSSGDVFGKVISFYMKLNPNHPKSINAFLQGVYHGTILSKIPFTKISTEEGFLNLFKQLLTTDGENLRRNSEELIEIFDQEVLSNLDKAFSEKIKFCIISYIIKSYEKFLYGYKTPAYLLLQWLKDRDEKLSLYVLKVILDEEIVINPSIVGSLLAGIFQIDDLPKLERLLNSTGQTEDVIYWILCSSQKEEFREAFKERFPQKYEELNLASKYRKRKKNIRQIKIESQEQRIFDKFINLLESRDYDVILFYLNNKENLHQKLKPTKVFALKSIISKVIDEFNPSHIAEGGDIVSWYNSNEKFFEDYTYYTGALVLAETFKISVKQYREKIILSLIFIKGKKDLEIVLRLLGSLSDEEVEIFINNYLLAENEEFYIDTFHTFLDLCSNLNIETIRIKSFFSGLIKSQRLKSYQTVRLIRFLGKSFDDPEHLKELFNFFSENNYSNNNRDILLAINEILLKRNDEEALEWRIEEIFNNQYALKEVNLPGLNIRRVLDEEGIGDPLKYITCPHYSDIMIDLVKRSFKLLRENSGKYTFVEKEIWRPAKHYFLQLQDKTILKNIIESLTQISDENRDLHYSYWFKDIIQKIRKEYSNVMNQPLAFGEAIKKYNRIKNTQYLDLASSEELFKLLKGVIRTELLEWIQYGYYKFIEQLSVPKGQKVPKETLIQKSIVTQLENLLLKKGFRSSDFGLNSPSIYREVQTLADKRIDILVSYGGIGPIMIEVKLVGNNDLKPGNINSYRDNTFIPYMKQALCDNGIFLILLLDKNKKSLFESTLERLYNSYDDMDEVSIIGIDCTK